ncbi:hypothetical protein WN51_07940 [Melipona quadrifasciata]|uniref:Uncharacterized protein n=1 Tax=Melipona quadrifasciata TaxID=166423 RepID=A0A0M8ZNL6_9HYME|nr:hypothetical protein WN51_07940 [Melipona quadrifasciata]
MSLGKVKLRLNKFRGQREENWRNGEIAERKERSTGQLFGTQTSRNWSDQSESFPVHLGSGWTELVAARSSQSTRRRVAVGGDRGWVAGWLDAVSSAPDNATPTRGLPKLPRESRDPNQPIANFRCISVAPEGPIFWVSPAKITDVDFVSKILECSNFGTKLTAEKCEPAEKAERGRTGRTCPLDAIALSTERKTPQLRKRGRSRGRKEKGERRKEKGDEARLYGHAHAQASPAVGPVACAAAGNCGGGDRGFTPPPPSSSSPLPRRGWRGVDQYVKIESDATHPAPLAPFEPQPLPGPAEGIAAQSTDLSPTHHFLRTLRGTRPATFPNRRPYGIRFVTANSPY